MKEKTTLQIKVDIEKDLMKDMLNLDEQAMYVIFNIINTEINDELEKKQRRISLENKTPMSIIVKVETDKK